MRTGLHPAVTASRRSFLILPGTAPEASALFLLMHRYDAAL